MSNTTRIFFATDLHGSEVCFRKLLSAGRVYEADVVIMGGDCTGKMLVPAVGAPEEPYAVRFNGEELRASGPELEELELKIKNSGFYPVRMTPEENARLSADPQAVSGLFTATMLETLRDWLSLAEKRMIDSGRTLVVTPGNDDEFAVDDVIRSFAFLEAGEGRVVRLPGGHEMLSLGWSNKTPWDTPRECSEPELRAKIDDLASEIEDMERAIFNIHVPPQGTGLDEAPEVDGDGNRLRGGSVVASVGSSAVRDAILHHQPLLSLHGHIHESKAMQRLGRTVCINPGSAYQDWTLQGTIVDLDDDAVSRYVLTNG